MKHHVFKTAMLGPASDYPQGSVKRAESLAISLNYTVANVRDIGTGRLIDILEETYAEEKKPWEIWPEGRPCKSPDAYFQYAANITVEQLAKLVEAYRPDHPLLRELRADQARADKVPTRQEHPGGRGKQTDSDAISLGRNQRGKPYILARLARDHPDILTAYEKGEYPSARAAGIAAGVVKPPTPYQEFRRIWKKASEDERRAIRDFLNEVAA